jgi:uncharacterized protein (TIGR02996 family)
MSAADRAAFLRAIAENPDDDLPRLVYADWLDEHGEPARAEFIRIQCELARLPRRSPRRAELEGRERELLAAREVAWRAELPVTFFTAHQGEHRPVPSVDYGRFERGFVGSVRVERFSMFRVIAEQVFSASPIHCLVAFGLARPMIRELLKMRILSTLTELDLSRGDVGNNGVDALLRSPHLARLNMLGLNIALVGDAGAQRLAESDRAGNLIRLDLASNRIEDTGAEALMASLHLTRIQTLNLQWNNFSMATRLALHARFGNAVIL